MKIVQRHLLRELLLNGLFTFLVLASMIVMLVFSIIALRTSTASLRVGALLDMVAYVSANRLDIVLPLTVLVATIWTYGRAHTDGEINAMRGSGIPLYQVVLPALLLGGFVMVSLVWLQDEIIPRSHYRQLVIGKSMWADNIEELLKGDDKEISDKRFKCIWRDVGGEGGYIHLEDVVVSQYMADGEPPRITRAKRAIPSLNKATGELRLTLREFVRGDELASEEMTVTLNLRALASEPPPTKRTDSMTYEELLTSSKRRPEHKRGRAARAEYHRRCAVALSALLFALLGAPLGLVMRSPNRAVVFAVGFLIVLLFNYGPMAIGLSLAKSGAVSPAISVWAGDLLVLGLALGTLRKAMAR